MNSEEITNIDDAIIADDKGDIILSDKNWLLVCDDYNEMYNNLMGMYACPLRMYDDFKKFRKMVWLNKDSNLSVAIKTIGINKYFLGQWEYPNWSKLKTQLLTICERQLIVKEEWIKKMRTDLGLNY